MVALLHSWVRRFTMIVFACCFQTSSQFSGQEFEEIYTNIESLETSKQVRIPQTRNFHCNEKCADRPKVCVGRCLVTGESIFNKQTM